MIGHAHRTVPKPFSQPVMQTHGRATVSLIPSIPGPSGTLSAPEDTTFGTVCSRFARKSGSNPMIRLCRALRACLCNLPIPNYRPIREFDRAGYASSGCEKPSRVAALHPNDLSEMGASAEDESAGREQGGALYSKAIVRASANCQARNLQSFRSTFTMRSFAILLSLGVLFVGGFAAPVSNDRRTRPDWHKPIKPPGHVNGRGEPFIEAVAVSLHHLKEKDTSYGIPKLQSRG